MGQQAYQEGDMTVESLALRAVKYLLSTDCLQNKGASLQGYVRVTAAAVALHPSRTASAGALGRCMGQVYSLNREITLLTSPSEPVPSMELAPL